MPVCKIDRTTIILLVRDLERTEHFYSHLLGLNLRRQDGYGSYYLIGELGSAVEIMFMAGDARPGNTPELLFDLPDGGIEDAVAGLIAAGVNIVTPIGEAPDGWGVHFADPDGVPVTLYQKNHKPLTLKESI